MTEKKFAKKIFNEEVETYLGKLRYHRAVNKMDPSDTLIDETGKDDMVLGA